MGRVASDTKHTLSLKYKYVNAYTALTALKCESPSISAGALNVSAYERLGRCFVEIEKEIVVHDSTDMLGSFLSSVDLWLSEMRQSAF